MATRDKVRDHMASILRQPADRMADATALRALVSDSFALVDMVIELQEEFGVLLVQDDLKGIQTVGDLLALFESRLGV